MTVGGIVGDVQITCFDKGQVNDPNPRKRMDREQCEYDQGQTFNVVKWAGIGIGVIGGAALVGGVIKGGATGVRHLMDKFDHGNPIKHIDEAVGLLEKIDHAAQGEQKGLLKTVRKNVRHAAVEIQRDHPLATHQTVWAKQETTGSKISNIITIGGRTQSEKKFVDVEDVRNLIDRSLDGVEGGLREAKDAITDGKKVQDGTLDTMRDSLGQLRKIADGSAQPDMMSGTSDLLGNGKKLPHGA